MSVSSIGSNSAPVSYQPRTPTTTTAKPDSDGDSAAVEASESAATKSAERANGGVAPKAAASTRPGGVNVIA